MRTDQGDNVDLILGAACGNFQLDKCRQHDVTQAGAGGPHLVWVANRGRRKFTCYPGPLALWQDIDLDSAVLVPQLWPTSGQLWQHFKARIGGDPEKLLY